MTRRDFRDEFIGDIDLGAVGIELTAGIHHAIQCQDHDLPHVGATRHLGGKLRGYHGIPGCSTSTTPSSAIRASTSTPTQPSQR